MILLTVCFQHSIQVGDFVLVEDESVMENEFKLIGLQTLVCSLTSCWFLMGITDTQSTWERFFYAPGQLTKLCL